MMRICLRPADLMSRHEREYLTVHGGNLETEKLACPSAVPSLEGAVAQIPQ